MTTFEIIILVVYYLFTFGFTLYSFGVFNSKEGRISAILLSIFICTIITPFAIGAVTSRYIENKLNY